MEIAVTGASGFIGGHLCEKLLKYGHTVYGIDKKEKKIEHDNYFHIKDDILLDYCQNHANIEQYIEEMDVFYHLASPVGVALVERDPQVANEIIMMNETISWYCALHQTKVVFASTSEVYGNIPDGEAVETSNLCIGSPMKARYGYSCAKLMSEFMFYRCGAPFIITRLFNIVGPGQTGAYGHVLPRFIDAAKNDEYLVVYGDGTQIRAFCDIRDCIDALYELGTGDYENEIFNIGTNRPITISSLADLVIKISGSKSEKHYMPYEDVYGPEHEDIKRRVPNIDKLRKTLNFEPKYSIEDTIRSML